jgi:intracellular septation protein A
MLVSLSLDERYHFFYQKTESRFEDRIEIPTELYEKLRAAEAAYYAVLNEVNMFVAENSHAIIVGDFAKSDDIDLEGL